MRIAIISFGHTGSSLPLAKALAKNKCEVDFYFDAHYGKINYAEGTDLRFKKARHLIGDIPPTACPLLKEYVNLPTLRLKYVNTLGEAKSLKLLTGFFYQIRRFQIHHICNCLNQLSYDAIYLVGRYTETEDIILYRKWINTRVIVGLHEVCNHFKPDFKDPSMVLKSLFDSATPIVVYSNNSYNDILIYKECAEDTVYLIPFGTFDTFKIYEEPSSLVLPESYYLYFGVINAYKGIPILAKAIAQITGLNCSFVIAGAGNDQSLELLKKDRRVLLINRFLSNQEIAHLVRNAKAVVCPYLTMSQSGIPQTVYAFGTPVIASDLEGFKEVVVPGENGLLFKSGDSNDLAQTIVKLENNKKLYAKIKRGANSFSQLLPNYDWNNIANQYIELFKQNKNK